MLREHHDIVISDTVLYALGTYEWERGSVFEPGDWEFWFPVEDGADTVRGTGGFSSGVGAGAEDDVAAVEIVERDVVEVTEGAERWLECALGSHGRAVRSCLDLKLWIGDELEKCGSQVPDLRRMQKRDMKKW
jgi:hypothetical protein